MSAKKKPEKDDPPPTKVNVEQHAYEAMRLLGWIIPTTEDDVERAEAMLTTEKIDLPQQLKDPYQLLESLDSDCPSFDPEPVAADVDVEENLARAAREGGTILPEIEQRMRRDRQAAEQQTR